MTIIHTRTLFVHGMFSGAGMEKGKVSGQLADTWKKAWMDQKSDVVKVNIADFKKGVFILTTPNGGCMVYPNGYDVVLVSNGDNSNQQCAEHLITMCNAVASCCGCKFVALLSYEGPVDFNTSVCTNPADIIKKGEYDVQLLLHGNYRTTVYADNEYKALSAAREMLENHLPAHLSNMMNLIEEGHDVQQIIRA